MFLAPFIPEIVAGIAAIAAVTSTVMSVNASNEALAEQNKAFDRDWETLFNSSGLNLRSFWILVLSNTAGFHSYQRFLIQ